MVGERAPLLRTAQPGHSHSEEERVSPFVSLARRRRQPVSLSPFFFATAQRPTLLSLPRNHGGAQSRHQGGRHDGRDAAGRGRLRGPGESEGKRGWAEVLLLLPNARRFGKKERGGGRARAGRGWAHVIVGTLPAESEGPGLGPGAAVEGAGGRVWPSRAESKKEGWPRSRPAARPASPPPSGPASHPSPFLVPLLTAQAIDKYTIEKDIATFVKKEFDKKHTPTWHCVVGRNFGERGEKERRGRGREGREGEARSGERGETNGCAAARAPGGPNPHLTGASLSYFFSRPGSYVTHETKHFIYFYIGACTERGGMRGAVVRERGKTRPTTSRPALTPPLFFSLFLARSLSSQASTPSSCSSPGDAITLTFVFLEERERACARAGRVCVGLV